MENTRYHGKQSTEQPWMRADSPYAQPPHLDEHINMGWTMKAAWRLFARNWFKLAVISLLPYLGLAVAGGILVILFPHLWDAVFYYGLDSLEYEQIGAVLLVGLLLAVGLMFFFAWIMAVKTKYVSDEISGNGGSFSEAFRLSFKATGRMLLYILLDIGASMLAYAILLLVTLGTEVLADLLHEILFTYLGIRLVCMEFAIVVESRGVFKSIARSFKLTGRNWWRIVGIQMAFFVPAALILFVIAFPALFLAVEKMWLPAVLLLVTAFLFFNVLEALAWSVLGTIYADRRTYFDEQESQKKAFLVEGGHLAQPRNEDR